MTDFERAGRRDAVTEVDPGTRTPAEVAHQHAVGPLDRIDWPSVGDEVLYHYPDRGWMPAQVAHVAEHDGDLRLLLPGDEGYAYDVKHGPHGHGWLLYREADRGLPPNPVEQP